MNHARKKSAQSRRVSRLDLYKDRFDIILFFAKVGNFQREITKKSEESNSNLFASQFFFYCENYISKIYAVALRNVCKNK